MCFPPPKRTHLQLGGIIWLFNIAMEAMAHRNRWFTELKNGDFPWQTVSHNQMVYTRN